MKHWTAIAQDLDGSEDGNVRTADIQEEIASKLDTEEADSERSSDE